LDAIHPSITDGGAFWCGFLFLNKRLIGYRVSLFPTYLFHFKVKIPLENPEEETPTNATAERVKSFLLNPICRFMIGRNKRGKSPKPKNP